MDYLHKPEFTIRVVRCPDCCRFYGFELSRIARCPHCAVDKYAALREQIDALEKSNAGLRGALKRKARP